MFPQRHNLFISPPYVVGDRGPIFRRIARRSSIPRSNRIPPGQRGGKRSMRRAFCAIFMMLTTSVVIASDAIFQLSGWAEIPSTYRHPGPVSGQFTTPNNGVTPPYEGQPIPGFSGMIPSGIPGSFIGLPDNGYGAQG